MALEITSVLYDEITEHLLDAYPNEASGLLLGHETEFGKRATLIVRAENSYIPEEQHHRYLITAKDVQAAETSADEDGLEVMGVYHSHPDHPAEPSSFDHENALPWWSYLILSIQEDRCETARCWQLTDDRSHFKEEELLIKP